MSVAELPDRRDEQAARGYDRTPPQDVAAEQAVLGGMLLSKDAIADVVEVLRGHDFYRPAHETIYEAVLDLYGRGEPADPLTVADELKKRGELGRIGGAPYLHTLVSSVPTAANAGFYAAIVREHALLRRLVEAGTRIVQMGYSGDGEADQIVDRAQAEVYSVTDRRTSEDYLPLGDIMEGTLDEIEAIGSRGGQMVGVPTGFADLDALTNGLHPGQMIVIAARPAIGKALALDTQLPTPTGWTTMGAVRVGDELIGADGKPTRVVAATEVMTDRPCYEVEFSDGSVIVADGRHQWVTTTRAGRRAAAERMPVRYYWPSGVVSTACAVAEAGTEFKNVVHCVVAEIALVERRPRQSRDPWRSYVWHAPGYSRRALLTTLAKRVSRPVNAWHAGVHDEVVTTEHMAATVRCASADRRPNHAVRLARPFDLPEAALPLPPYTLGVWLGDGDSAGAVYTSHDPEIATHVRAEGIEVMEYRPHRYRLRLPRPEPPTRSCVVCGVLFVPGIRCQACHRDHGTVNAILRSMGVLGNKHIPEIYLRGSERQRRALLAGLLDTNGTINKAGCVEFDVTNGHLAEDTLELIHSLGYRARIRTRRVKGRTEESSTCYRIAFTPGGPVFNLARKRKRQRFDHAPTARMVVDVRRVESVPVRCVEVGNAEHLYLAGRSCIPTHNSTLGLDIARAAAIRHQLTSVMFSLEMSRNEITMRLLSAEARVPLHHMRSGQMTDDDWGRIARRTGEVSSAPLFIDDSPNMTMMEIRAKCRRLRQRHDLRLVIIDYLQLMTSGKRVESRQQEVAEFSRALKLLAKELDVPVIAISQLNRSAEQRTDKKPMLADLRESGSIEQDSDMVILLHREDAYEKESPRAGEADFIVAKHRNGPTATITVAFQGHYSRFVDMAT